VAASLRPSVAQVPVSSAERLTRRTHRIWLNSMQDERRSSHRLVPKRRPVGGSALSAEAGVVTPGYAFIGTSNARPASGVPAPISGSGGRPLRAYPRAIPGHEDSIRRRQRGDSCGQSDSARHQRRGFFLRATLDDSVGGIGSHTVMRRLAIRLDSMARGGDHVSHVPTEVTTPQPRSLRGGERPNRADRTQRAQRLDNN
jgi:hypothetical protein